MIIYVNDEIVDFEGETLDILLKKSEDINFVVALNGALIKKNEYSKTSLKQDDKIDILTIAEGG